ncbi:hypothetical protein M2163_009207 [Streptomyces sp. SAI-135]|nr:hypothetical protein [Streptomyces sp. SAI-090]MDH6622099.1 hypothetical protein [Streptomyces sp. SAI-135]
MVGAVSVSRRGAGTSSPSWCPLIRPARSAPVPGSAARGGVSTGSDEVESSTVGGAIGPAVPLSGVVAATGDTSMSSDGAEVGTMWSVCPGVRTGVRSPASLTGPFPAAGAPSRSPSDMPAEWVTVSSVDDGRVGSAFESAAFSEGRALSGEDRRPVSPAVLPEPRCPDETTGSATGRSEAGRWAVAEPSSRRASPSWTSSFLASAVDKSRPSSRLAGPCPDSSGLRFLERFPEDCEMGDDDGRASSPPDRALLWPEGWSPAECAVV